MDNFLESVKFFRGNYLVIQCSLFIKFSITCGILPIYAGVSLHYIFIIAGSQILIETFKVRISLLIKLFSGTRI